MRWAVVATVAVGSIGCARDDRHVDAATAGIAVRAGVDGLLLHGQRWWPSGFNAPQLGTRYSINVGCGAETDADAYFERLPPNSLTRFNLFQALAVDKTNNTMNFQAVDAVFRAAERSRQLVLPVLAPQDGGCDDDRFKQHDWYIDGWTATEPVPGRAVLSFRDWVATAVDRWKDVPVLAGWELMGEAEASVCGDAECSAARRTCPADAARVLRQFMDRAGGLVRERDPGRIIFAGFAGGGQCGTAGEDYRYVGASPKLDVLDYHDYSPDLTTLPGNSWDGLAVRLRQARELGKPLLIGEVGVKAGGCESLAARRVDLGRKLTTQRDAGAAGALLWAFVPDPRSSECTWDIGPEDPLWGLVAERITLTPQ
ncbi:beta-mannosidase [Nocardia panacis]|uniref:Beta-mannosidase n=1 Tax=Nocardia panacis TaxID=2340916 RepID=A0A3A4KC53_9NOCA|nr:beta-mannosidase [Nocardia panacis]